jgi:hypothetical protein
LLWITPGAACGPQVNSEEDARRAYLGLDASVDRAITLGFAGFNSAKSANIDPQTAMGGMGGTLTVTGQVDQGASDNKGMRLSTAYSMYTDDGKLVYATPQGALPLLTMQLRKIPNGTLDGTLAGKLLMSGELQGEVTLTLTFTAQLQPDPADMKKVTRKPGTTKVTGTATSPAGVYQVNVMR